MAVIERSCSSPLDTPGVSERERERELISLTVEHMAIPEFLFMAHFNIKPCALI